MNLGVGISGELQQKLSVGMIQGLNMLQMTAQQLEQVLRAELEQNPLLEIDMDAEMDVDMDADDDDRNDDNDNDDDYDDDREEEFLEELNTDSNKDEIDWEEYLEDGFGMGDNDSYESENYYDDNEPKVAYEETLIEFLEKQLNDKKLGEQVKLLVQFLIGSLDDDGYLRLTDDEIVSVTGANICEIEEALCVLRRFDPAGIGARDLRDCLMLQLARNKMEESVAMKIVRDYWGLFEKLKIAEIEKRLGVSKEEVMKAIDVLKTLTPRPGYQHNSEKTSGIIPDIIVEKIDGKYVVLQNDRSIPTLCINKNYAHMVRKSSGVDKNAREYVRERLNSATWFIKSIEQRRTTISRVMYAIIDRQKMFFDKGPAHLAPLKQREIAEAIGMHLSTVSRVTRNKYVQTQYGIFELKHFFTEAIAVNNEEIINTTAGAIKITTSKSDVHEVTPERVQSRIKQFIEDEDPAVPLSDQKIADMLKAENLPTARRTVAKYREAMKILPSHQRHKYAR